MTSPLGYVECILPSRGALYGDRLPGGKVEVRKLTLKEDMIIQSSASGVTMLSKIVGACTKLPAGITHDELLISDRYAILLAIRVFTFDPEYRFTYRCTSCGETSPHTCNMKTDISEKEIKGALREPVEVFCKDLNKRLTLKFLRGKDEVAVANAVKQRKSAGLDGESDMSDIIRLGYQIDTVDGEALPALERERFVSSLTLPDARDIRDALDDAEPGVDPRLYPECPKCGFRNELVMPLTVEFFRPARRKA